MAWEITEQPGFACLTNGHISIQMHLNDAVLVWGSWCLWCGTGVYGDEEDLPKATIGEIRMRQDWAPEDYPPIIRPKEIP